jgi:hypothetical protein
LAGYTKDDVYARAMHQRFKFEVIAKLSHQNWRLTDEAIDKWISEHPITEERPEGRGLNGA